MRSRQLQALQLRVPRRWVAGHARHPVHALFQGQRQEYVRSLSFLLFSHSFILLDFIDLVNEARRSEMLRLTMAAMYNDLQRNADTAWLRVAEWADNFLKSFPPSVYAELFESPQVLFDLISRDPGEVVDRVANSFSRLDINQMTATPDFVNGRRTNSAPQFQEGSSRDGATAAEKEGDQEMEQDELQDDSS